MADRVFELSSAHSRVVLGHLGGTEALAQQFAHLASAVIYSSETHRAPANILRQNRKGQSGLWSSGISKLPIVLVRASRTQKKPSAGARHADGARLLADEGVEHGFADLE